MQRRAIEVCGIVQGVGFRPFVFHLAKRLALAGFVQNCTDRVKIEVEGDSQALDDFAAELATNPPPLARIDRIETRQLAGQGETQFTIRASDESGSGPVFLSPDVATCEACLVEMRDSASRRYRYAFTNCTHCGPRLTIITGAPYDRPQTTMAGFEMCESCRREYDNPADRRFHAQPICCPACGPRLELLDAAGRPLATADPLADFAAAICSGQIGALKGLGGFHLVCDGLSEGAVARLRARKHREEKPLALMTADLPATAELCEIDDAEVALLSSPRRPIVLLRKKAAATTPIAESVAPGNACLGVMLPYTPLHHLLLEACGRPLVVTSGNRSDEPIAYRDSDLPRQLVGIADCFLTHNRPIHVRCDDSVFRVIQRRTAPARRSRGYAPEPIRLAVECPQPMLAVGGQLKATFALSRQSLAFVSHHLGDLDHLEAFQAFERDVPLYEALFAVRPEVLIHDEHPDYASTAYAVRRAAADSLMLVAVQHHHAHLASCLCENGVTGPAIGVIFDGTGYGSDGAIWGGEILLGDCREFQRVAHLRYVGLPGGDQAVREPWRVAVAHLLDADMDPGVLRPRPNRTALRAIGRMLASGFRAPRTSSMGRLFDAVAALAGVRQRISYEGQAAIELEALVAGVAPQGRYDFALTGDGAEPIVVDTRPLIRNVAADVGRGTPIPVIARRFHTTIVELVAELCGRVRQSSGVERVALSGGVFLNVLLSRELPERLAADGFEVYVHERVPAGDGGLSLGQLAVAAARLAQEPAASDFSRTSHDVEVSHVLGDSWPGRRNLSRT